MESPMLDWRWTDDGGENWGQVNFAKIVFNYWKQNSMTMNKSKM